MNSNISSFRLFLACSIITLTACLVPAIGASGQFAPPRQMEIAGLQSLTAKAVRLHRAGRTEAAITTLETVAAHSRRQFGRDDPRFAQALNNLALLYDMSGRLDRAENTYLEAVAIIEAQSDPQHAQLADLHNNLASVVLQQCRIADAQKLYARALTTLEATHGPSHIDTVMVRANVDRLTRYLSPTSPPGSVIPPGGERTIDTGVNALLQRCLS